MGRNGETLPKRRVGILIGALRIDEILKAGQKPKDAKPSNAQAAAQNAHFLNGKGVLDPHNFVFIGSKSHCVFSLKQLSSLLTDWNLIYYSVRSEQQTVLYLHQTVSHIGVRYQKLPSRLGFEQP